MQRSHGPATRFPALFSSLLLFSSSFLLFSSRHQPSPVRGAVQNTRACTGGHLRYLQWALKRDHFHPLHVEGNVSFFPCCSLSVSLSLSLSLNELVNDPNPPGL